ncbi:hypothetical protein JCM5353_003932 [Sporobolomyces roseus]
MNAHHKKSTYRPPPPRTAQHYSSNTLKLPLEKGDKEPTAARQLWRAIERVPFGWQLDVLIPEIGTSRQHGFIDRLKAELEQSSRSQLVRTVNLADLLEPGFMNSYIRKGSLIAISLDDDDVEDVVSIDGRGRLVLAVNKDTYELLGLPGRASMHGSLRQRFIIEISLIDPAFKAGKPGFERVKRLLRAWPGETQLFEQLKGESLGSRTFDLLMAYVDDEGQRQSINLPRTTVSHEHNPSFSTQTLDNISVPSSTSLPSYPPDSKTASKRQRTSSGSLRREADDEQIWWDGFREWRGLASIGSDRLKWRSNPVAEEQEEGWGFDQVDCERGRTTALSLNGLLHPQAMKNSVDWILQDASFSTIPFLSIMLRPFPHSPISHTSKADPPVVGTGTRPNEKKRKRGRGRGEEEEADTEKLQDAGGYEIVLQPVRMEEIDTVTWWMWEGQ